MSRKNKKSRDDYLRINHSRFIRDQKRIKKEPDWLIYLIILYIAIFGTLSLIYFIRW